MWEQVDHARSRPIEEMQVWDGLSDARITFNAPEAQPDPFAVSSSNSLFPEIEPMATLVENLNLQRALLRTLKQRGSGAGGVEILDGAKVLGIAEGDGGWPVLTVEGAAGTPPRQLRARLLVRHSSSLSYAQADVECRSGRTDSILQYERILESTRSAGRTTLTES